MKEGVGAGGVGVVVGVVVDASRWKRPRCAGWVN